MKYSKSNTTRSIDLSCVYCGALKVEPVSYHVYSYMHAHFNGYEMSVNDDLRTWNFNLESKYRDDLEKIFDLTLVYRCLCCSSDYTVVVNSYKGAVKLTWLKEGE